MSSGLVRRANVSEFPAASIIRAISKPQVPGFLDALTPTENLTSHLDETVRFKTGADAETCLVKVSHVELRPEV